MKKAAETSLEMNLPGGIFCCLESYQKSVMEQLPLQYVMQKTHCKPPNEEEVNSFSVNFSWALNNNKSSLFSYCQSREKKVDFLPPSVSRSTSALPEVVSHDKASNHSSTWFRFSSCYHSTWPPSCRMLSLYNRTTCTWLVIAKEDST